MVGTIKRRTSRGKMIRKRNTVSILEGKENRKKEVNNSGYPYRLMMW